MASSKLTTSSYVHLHSLDSSLRTVAAIIRVVVHVLLHLSHSTLRRTSRTAHSGRRLLAIIESLYHATRVGTGFRQQEIVLEYSIVVIRSDAIVDHLWPVVLKVLHEPSLSVVHQIILVGRASLILRVVESRGCRIWIRAEIVDVQVFVDTHETAVSILRSIKGTIAVTAD